MRILKLASSILLLFLAVLNYSNSPTFATTIQTGDIRLETRQEALTDSGEVGLADLYITYLQKGSEEATGVTLLAKDASPSILTQDRLRGLMVWVANCDTRWEQGLCLNGAQNVFGSKLNPLPIADLKSPKLIQNFKTSPGATNYLRYSLTKDPVNQLQETAINGEQPKVQDGNWQVTSIAATNGYLIFTTSTPVTTLRPGHIIVIEAATEKSYNKPFQVQSIPTQNSFIVKSTFSGINSEAKAYLPSAQGLTSRITWTVKQLQKSEKFKP